MKLFSNLGGEQTKFGFFVPTNVSKPQSPYNFVLAAAYKGPETRELIQKATHALFSFANNLSSSGELHFTNGMSLKVDVLFVADLKMFPLVIGCNYHSAKQFCPFCDVTRDAHREKSSVGNLYTALNDSALLKLRRENIVVPPLHSLQGATNTILAKMDELK